MNDIPQRIFITGTDTEVGKTVATAALASCLKKNGHSINVIKPFQTGTEVQAVTDIEFVYGVLGESFDMSSACPVRLKKPLSPLYASKIEGVSYEITEIVGKVENALKEDCINLVEGAGGILVPIKNNYFMSDLARELNLSVVVVARPGLGTVNHTLLTIEHAVSCGLSVLGIVISNFPANPNLAESTNISQLKELCEFEILGIIPEIEGLDVENGLNGDLGEKSQDFFIKSLGGTLDLSEFIT